MGCLIDVGTSSKPNLSNIMEIVLKTNVFYEKPYFSLTHVKKGLGEFWEDISKDALDALWTMYTLTHSNVLEYLNVEVTSPVEKKTESYISRYLRSLDRDSLSLFVQFCTGSSIIERGSSIKVVFENQDDRNFVIRAAACFKIFHCPKNCSCYKQFKTACDGVLHNPTMWSTDDKENENFD